MRAHEFLIESGQWELLNSTDDKEQWSKELIQLVQNAYKNSNLGSFVNSLNDVKRSNWLVLDWDDCNQPDSAIFYRHNRPNETWVGYKIQGVGHDGLPESKRSVIIKVKEQLSKPGWWIESNAIGPSVGKYSGAPAVKDEKLLQAIFPNADLKILDQTGRYERKLADGTSIQEYIFGNPSVKTLNTR